MSYPYDPTWECYPFTSRPVGESSEREITIKKEYTGNLTIDGTVKVQLFSRDRDYHTKYERTFSFGDPMIGELDGSVNEAGTNVTTSSGSISEKFSFVDTELIFMDLRHDIFVYRKSEGNFEFTGSGGNPIGTCLIDDGNGLQTHNTQDVIGVDVSHIRHFKQTEKLIVSSPSKDVELYIDVTEEPVDLKLGVTDYSGWCGALSYGCLLWGTYGVVDETKPHPNKDNYTSLYEVGSGSYPADYLPPWVQDFARFSEMDIADAERFLTLFGTNTTRQENIDLPVPNDPFPQGSWAVDKDGNMFFSQLHSGGVYNVLIQADGTETDPVTVVDMSGDNPVYYPIVAT